jgi:hypothetical protein
MGSALVLHLVFEFATYINISVCNLIARQNAVEVSHHPEYHVFSTKYRIFHKEITFARISALQFSSCICGLPYLFLGQPGCILFKTLSKSDSYPQFITKQNVICWMSRAKIRRLFGVSSIHFHHFYRLRFELTNKAF